MSSLFRHTSPQALGWFKKPLRSVADLKGMKCRQTGLNAELYAKLGMAIVNTPGGEIVHYTPGMHENTSIGEIGFNLDTWKGLTPHQRDAIDAAVKDAFITWIVRWQRQNAEALEELIEKHGVQVRRTPPDILLASLKAWDEVAKSESEKNPVFKRVYESQRDYAANVVPAKRYMFPPCSFAANYYWPEDSAKPKAAAKGPAR